MDFNQQKRDIVNQLFPKELNLSIQMAEETPERFGFLKEYDKEMSWVVLQEYEMGKFFPFAYFVKTPTGWLFQSDFVVDNTTGYLQYLECVYEDRTGVFWIEFVEKIQSEYSLFHHCAVVMAKTPQRAKLLVGWRDNGWTIKP